MVKAAALVSTISRPFKSSVMLINMSLVSPTAKLVLSVSLVNLSTSIVNLRFLFSSIALTVLVPFFTTVTADLRICL